MSRVAKQKRATALARLCCLICITDILSGCATPQPRQRETYVVRPQDTLYSIAWRHDLDFRELAQWNNIGPDFRLSVGQVLVLQPADGAPARGAARSSPTGAARGSITGSNASRPVGGRPATAPVPSALAQPPASRSQSSPRVDEPKPLAGAAVAGGAAAGGGSAAAAPAVTTPGVTASGATVAAGAAAAGSVSGATMGGGGSSRWLWPTEHSTPPRAVPGGGILLFGRLGQDVRAAGAGRVVYTGSGIRGYGNLIILKHGENLLSSYAHNSEMLVHEGQEVAQGQIIAHMGTAAHQTSALYFEIRLNGKPVDPLKYLPGGR